MVAKMRSSIYHRRINLSEMKQGEAEVPSSEVSDYFRISANGILFRESVVFRGFSNISTDEELRLPFRSEVDAGPAMSISTYQAVTRSIAFAHSLAFPVSPSSSASKSTCTKQLRRRLTERPQSISPNHSRGANVPIHASLSSNKTDSNGSSSTSSFNDTNADSGTEEPLYEIPDFTIPGDPTMDRLIEAAQKAADVADNILLRYFRQPVPVDYKSDNSPVTLADKEVELAVREAISESFPDHTIFGEEGDGAESINPESKGFVWIIDPIDGTRAFVCGRPTFVTLISLLYDGGPILGVVSQCVTRERWVGALGRQTTLNGKGINCETASIKKFGRTDDDGVAEDEQMVEKMLSKCVLEATTPDMFIGIDRILFRRVSKHVKNIVYGGDGYAYALLANGFGDIVLEADLKPWDFMALVPIVEGAGGYMSDWGGAPLSLWSDGRVLATASFSVFQGILRILAVPQEEYDLVPYAVQASRNLAVNLGDSATLPEDPGPGSVESMTGFGRAVVQRNSIFVRVQISSVNSRYCEVAFKGGRSLSGYESEIVALVKKLAVRGRVSVTLDIDANGLFPSSKDGSRNNNAKNVGSTDEPIKSNTVASITSNSRGDEGGFSNSNSWSDNRQLRKLSVSVDEKAVREARALLDQVAKAGNVDTPPSISDILRFSEVFVRQDTNIPISEVIPLVKEAIVKAMEELIVSRRREGAILEEDILRRTRKISGILEEIGSRSPLRKEKERARLSKILQSNSVDIDTPRMETELAIFADKVDFSEEVVRLRAHVEAFEITFIGSTEPIGQRLGFLVQEMHREANTLSVKAFDAAVSHLAVMIKEEIEKIREQCSNLR